ncbi:uncharacterized protein [Euwallacea similis]|uniref:uncharacterized protein n=1 Tax=Euwallacea similis TaxID=1736056 RepID=UPI00344CFE26
MGSSPSKDEPKDAQTEAREKDRREDEGRIHAQTEKAYLEEKARRLALEKQLESNNIKLAEAKAEAQIKHKFVDRAFAAAAKWQTCLEEQQELQQQKLQIQLEGERIQLEKQQLKLKVQRMELESQYLELNGMKQKAEEKTFLKCLIKSQVALNMELLNQLLQVFHQKPLADRPAKPYEEKILNKKSSQYQNVFGLFERSCKSCFTITQIRQIVNPFHVIQYNIMKMKYRKINRKEPQKHSMFHGTKQEHLDGICRYNFDKSKAVNGMGISFVRYSYFATHFHKDNKKRNEKVMILANVLIGETEVVQPKLLNQLPSKSYTTTNEKGNVIVKFDDASCYPHYIIYYQGLHPN